MQAKDTNEDIGLLKIKNRALQMEMKEMRRAIVAMRKEIEDFKLSVCYTIVNRRLMKEQ